MTEQQLQAACFIWHWNTYPQERRMLFHADNNSVNRYVGNQKKSAGVVKGVSDFILICKDVVVFIEMKTLIGVQSGEQKDFMRKINELGHPYFIIRSAEEFKKLITKLYGQ